MITETVLQQVKNSEDTKLILKNRMKDFTELNTGTKAELAKKLLCDVAVYEEAVQIMGEGLNEAEIEIECLETKNKELEKELNMSDEDKEDLINYITIRKLNYKTMALIISGL